MAVPQLNYNYFEYNIQGTSAIPTKKILDHLPEEAIHVSFQEGYNQLKLKYIPNTPLIYYEIRITPIDGEFGIGVGTKWYHNGPNIAGSTEQTVTLNISSEYFPIPTGKTSSNGGYRIGLYAKASGNDGFWDVTYLFLTTEKNGEHKIYAPNGNDGLTVITNDPIPND